MHRLSSETIVDSEMNSFSVCFSRFKMRFLDVIMFIHGFFFASQSICGLQNELCPHSKIFGSDSHARIMQCCLSSQKLWPSNTDFQPFWYTEFSRVSEPCDDIIHFKWWNIPSCHNFTFWSIILKLCHNSWIQFSLQIGEALPFTLEKLCL